MPDVWGVILGHFRDRRSNDDGNGDAGSTHPSNSIVGKQGFF